MTKSVEVSLASVRDAMVVLYESMALLQTYAIDGGYAGAYHTGNGRTYGESLKVRLADGEILLQQNATPAVGEVLLRAYEVTGDRQLLKSAIAVGKAIAVTQKSIGGWGYTAVVVRDTSHDATVTLDDDVTQGSLRFLMNLDRYVDALTFDTAISRGLNFLEAFQAANGAWHQTYPEQGSYRDDFAFNDRAIPLAIEAMAQAHASYGGASYRAAAISGAEFTLATQFGSGQAGWAQQYDDGLRPVRGRAFEPPAVASAETAAAVQALLAVNEIAPDARYVAAAAAAVEWLSRSMLSDGEWARLYEIGSNRPIYVSKIGDISYSVDQANPSYRWTGDFGNHDVIQQFTLLQVAPQRYAEIYGGSNDDFITTKLTILAHDAEALSAQFDKKGWLSGSYLYTGTFVENAGRLLDYLDAVHDGMLAGGDDALWQDLVAQAQDIAGGEHLPPVHGNFAPGQYERTLIGGAGADGLLGTSGDDVLLGGAGRDTLAGGDGDDTLVGGMGADAIDGGTGIDRVDYSVSTAAIRVDLDQGTGNGGDAEGDRIRGIEDVVGSRFADVIRGSNDGRNVIGGGAGDDNIYGLDGNDILGGGDGDDYLNGGAGADKLAGEEGRDLLAGGAGADIFDFNRLRDSSVGDGSDHIRDFSTVEGDRIDLRTIDANATLPGNQDFSFIGNQALTKHAGELHTVSAGGATIVEGDVDGDGHADFQIVLDKIVSLGADDFLL